ncbi:hypothetical protein CAEBREN_16265 [Caenorhabditis brenneri]|uniref:Uncharacterized protein n=1 Tax=Caenorhabditis brenneri TaxID=135651 RepID=G0MJA9_CAEBE|nr:hypothetical protein CAEBREN_16265 [Caenorhabditis brenneri]
MSRKILLGVLLLLLVFSIHATHHHLRRRRCGAQLKKSIDLLCGKCSTELDISTIACATPLSDLVFQMICCPNDD